MNGETNKKRRNGSESPDSVDVFDEITNVKHEAPLTIISVLKKQVKYEPQYGTIDEKYFIDLENKPPTQQVSVKVKSENNTDNEEDFDLDFDEKIDDDNPPASEPVKRERSVEYLVVLPPDDAYKGLEMPRPVTIKKDPENSTVRKSPASSPTKIPQNLERVKREGSVEYLVVLPPDDADKGLEMPRPVPIKKDPENSKVRNCSVHLKKFDFFDESKSFLSKSFFVCTICHEIKIFSNELDFKNHRQHTKAPLKTYDCEICKWSFFKISRYEVHGCKMKVSKLKPWFECKYCKKRFAHRESLSQHIEIHIEEMKEPCDICGKRMVKSRLAQHKRMTHFAKKMYQCDLCPSKAKQLVTLLAHLRSHIKPFECKICKKKISEERYFKEHVLNHKNPNPFKCTKCSSGYTRKTSLIRHMQTAHSDARNFPCAEKGCKYRGKTKDDLTTHIKSHTRAYKCDLCTRKFSRSSLLKQHRVLHENPNAYQCTICYIRYTEKKQLKLHIFKKHSEENSPKKQRANKRKHESSSDSYDDSDE